MNPITASHGAIFLPADTSTCNGPATACQAFCATHLQQLTASQIRRKGFAGFMGVGNRAYLKFHALDAVLPGMG